MKSNLGGDDSWLFMSVFYRQEKWHDLLVTINRVLLNLQKGGIAPAESLIYFSSHRGDNIRLALRYKFFEQNNYSFIEGAIKSFLVEHPSDKKTLILPISAFFKDFPANHIRYNLFDGHYILSDGLKDLQLLLSKILSVFFFDHPVDEEGIFTLLIYLQTSILENICATREERIELCIYIMSKMLQNKKEIPETTIEVTGTPNLGFPQTIIEECNTITLLKAFGKACKNFYLFNGQLSVSYLTILNIIQLHMLRKIEGAFFEPLQYILSSILNEPANTLMPDYNSALH